MEDRSNLLFSSGPVICTRAKNNTAAMGLTHLLTGKVAISCVVLLFTADRKIKSHKNLNYWKPYINFNCIVA